MRRPRLIFAGALLSCFIVLTGIPLSSAGKSDSVQTVPQVADEPTWQGPAPPWADVPYGHHHFAGPMLFQLQVTRSVYECPAETRSYKPVPIVDSELVRQINQVRIEVPSWRGLPHLLPGGSGKVQ